MSYLDVPRIHFAGSFYYNPGTLNNATMNYSNYNGSQPGQFFPNEANTRWNPNGDMQFYFANCKVATVLDANATLHSNAKQDPLIGARVDTQGPYGVLGNFNGAPTSAGKISDYDPDQQYRSQINGTWVGVVIPPDDPYDFDKYTGFYGFMQPCNLRDLGLVWFQMRGNPAAGNFFSKIKIHSWIGDVSQSALMTAFKDKCEDEVAVRFTMDFFQGSKGVSGDDFGFGRVQGNFAPVAAGDLNQLTPCRRLGTYTNMKSEDPGDGEVEVQLYVPKSLERGDTGNDDDRVAEAMERVADDDPWQWYGASPYKNYTMPAFARVLDDLSILTLDLGTALPQARGMDGTTKSVLTDFRLGYQDGGSFVPLTNGAISITDSDYGKFSSPQKTINYLEQTGLFNIPLESGEAEKIASRPLSLQVVVEGEAHLARQEDEEGHYIDVDPPAIRIEQGETFNAHLMWTKFGAPVPNGDIATELKLYEFDIKWKPNPNMPPGQTLFRYTWDITPAGTNGVPGDISFSMGQTNGDGIADLVITAGTGAMNLQGPREGMLGRVSFLLRVPREPGTEPPTGSWEQAPNAYSEPATGLEFFTVLVWQKYDVPDNPTWDKDVSILMPLLAELYPGMASKLDIGDEKTLLDNRKIFISYLSKTLDDPAYMPVTRELSASRLAMLRKWLETAQEEEVTTCAS